MLEKNKELVKWDLALGIAMLVIIAVFSKQVHYICIKLQRLRKTVSQNTASLQDKTLPKTIRWKAV